MTFGQLFLVVLASFIFISQTFAAAQSQRAGIRYNQLGYLPRNYKTVVIPAVDATRFHLLSVSTNEKMYSAPLGDKQYWELSDENIKIADFSGFAFQGEYQLQIEGLKRLPIINIQKDVYREPLQAVLKSFYFNRASLALEEDFAGVYKRPAGHADTLVYVHESASSASRPAGTTLSAPKGWYDAGGYNKYLVRSASAAMFLLHAYRDYSDLFSVLTVNIPESSNKIPDVLDELKWTLDWMLDMQDPDDGGVYHQLSSQSTADFAMPHTQYQRRYMLAKSTEASLIYAATLARAARTFKAFDPVLSARYADAALLAYQWAQSNPELKFALPESFSRLPVYDDAENDLGDEFRLANIELYLLTSKKKYLKKADLPERIGLPNANSWDAFVALGIMEDERLSRKQGQQAKAAFLALADDLVSQYDSSAYEASITETDYLANSNRSLLAKAFVLSRANVIEPKVDYDMAASALIDYMFGRNPAGYSFVTGFGEKSPKNVHHRISRADNVETPIQGLLVSGVSVAGKNSQECEGKSVIFKTDITAKAYADHQCRYSTNAVDLVSSALLTYVLAGQYE